MGELKFGQFTPDPPETDNSIKFKLESFLENFAEEDARKKSGIRDLFRSRNSDKTEKSVNKKLLEVIEMIESLNLGWRATKYRMYYESPDGVYIEIHSQNSNCRICIERKESNVGATSKMFEASYSLGEHTETYRYLMRYFNRITTTIVEADKKKAEAEKVSKAREDLYKALKRIEEMNPKWKVKKDGDSTKIWYRSTDGTYIELFNYYEFLYSKKYQPSILIRQETGNGCPVIIAEMRFVEKMLGNDYTNKTIIEDAETCFYLKEYIDKIAGPILSAEQETKKNLEQSTNDRFWGK